MSTTDTEAFKPTGKTVTHHGTTYDILLTDDPDADSPYILRSKRGNLYMLARNVPNPTHLFAVSWTNLRNLPGWFTDKSGELTSLC